MLNITFNKTKPSQRQYEYSIVGNAQVDVVRFVLQSDICSEYGLIDLSNFNVYVKVQSAGGEYIDKISATSEFDGEKNTLTVDFMLLKKTTQFKNISLQLQFESDEGVIVAQTEIVCLTLKGSINADKEIPDLFPSVLSQMEHELADHEERIEELEQGGGGGESKIKSVDVSYSNDELNVSLKDKDGQVLMGDSATLPFSSKVDKVEGKGLSTNDLTDLLKSKIINSVENVGVIDASDHCSDVYEQILHGSTFAELEDVCKYFVCYLEGIQGFIPSGNYLGVLYDDYFIDFLNLNGSAYYSISSGQPNDILGRCSIVNEKHYTDKEYVDALIQNLREIIAGKTNSYVISYQAVAPTQATFQPNTYKRIDGTFIQTWEDFKEYTNANAFGNNLFNSQSRALSFVDYYLIQTDNTVVDYTQLLNGDNIYVIELEIPDRWYSKTDDKMYILETAKVDLTAYANKSADETITGTWTFPVGTKIKINDNYYYEFTDDNFGQIGFKRNGQYGITLDGYTVRNLEGANPRTNNAYSIGTSSLRWQTVYTENIDSSSTFVVKINGSAKFAFTSWNILPYGHQDLGSSSCPIKDIHLDGKLKDGTKEVSVGDIVQELSIIKLDTGTYTSGTQMSANDLEQLQPLLNMNIEECVKYLNKVIRWDNSRNETHSTTYISVRGSSGSTPTSAWYDIQIIFPIGSTITLTPTRLGNGTY